MINSTEFDNVFWVPEGAYIQYKTLKGGWYFWDEAGLLGGGPYYTELECSKNLDKHVEWLKNEN